ncbi:MAG: hypothetical protein L6R39_004484 [Caloplaca ligustica]|nr:MAG: hypothetical protein L6R39_004484 [Caloplaca ligustica]
MLTTFIVFLFVNAFIVRTAPNGPRLPSPTSGNMQEMDNPCLTYSSCGTKGHQYWTGLMKTLASPNPQDKDGDFDIFETLYLPLSVHRDGAGQDVAQDLVVHGLSSIDEYYKWDVSPRLSGHGHEDEAPYQNLFNSAFFCHSHPADLLLPFLDNDFTNIPSAKDGVIIATYNWRPLDPLQKLYWSDIVYQSYLLNLEPGQSISALQAVIQTDIVNPGTFRVLQSAYKAKGLDPDTDKTWRKWTLADQYFFYGFLGTDNVKGTLYLLNDHPVTIGKKVITEIWTRADPVFDMWINLGPYEPSTLQDSAA